MSAIEITVQAVNDQVGLPIREIIECMQKGKFHRLEIKESPMTEHHFPQRRYLLFVEDTEGNKSVQRIDTQSETNDGDAPNA